MKLEKHRLAVVLKNLQSNMLNNSVLDWPKWFTSGQRARYLILLIHKYDSIQNGLVRIVIYVCTIYHIY